MSTDRDETPRSCPTCESLRKPLRYCTNCKRANCGLGVCVGLTTCGKSQMCADPWHNAAPAAPTPQEHHKPCGSPTCVACSVKHEPLPYEQLSGAPMPQPDQMAYTCGGFYCGCDRCKAESAELAATPAPAKQYVEYDSAGHPHKVRNTPVERIETMPMKPRDEDGKTTVKPERRCAFDYNGVTCGCDPYQHTPGGRIPHPWVAPLPDAPSGAEEATPAQDHFAARHKAWMQFLADHPTRGGLAEHLIFQAGWDAGAALPVPEPPTRCPVCGSRNPEQRMCVVENCGESHIARQHLKVVCSDSFHHAETVPEPPLDTEESKCPRCFNGLYNGPCVICNGTGKISEASLLGKAVPETRPETPREDDPMLRKCQCVCHKVGLWGLLCCSCAERDLIMLIRKGMGMPLSAPPPAGELKERGEQ